MAKFKFSELITQGSQFTARLGSASGSANYLTDKEVGKAVKLVGDSQYDLAAAGDPIEGFIDALEAAPADDFSIGTVRCNGRKKVILDGLEATPGTGTIAIGDIVVTGTVVAKGTALSAPLKVCKATNQPGTVPANLTAAGAQAKIAMYAWRLVSASGTAVGSTGVIERVSA